MENDPLKPDDLTYEYAFSSDDHAGEVPAGSRTIQRVYKKVVSTESKPENPASPTPVTLILSLDLHADTFRDRLFALIEVTQNNQTM